MADSTVHISSIDADAIGEAFDGLPAWATEDTLSSINGILVKSFKVQESSLKELTKLLKKSSGSGAHSGSIDPEIKKCLSAITQFAGSVEGLAGELAKANKEAKAKTDQEEKSTSSLASWSTVLTSMASVGNKALDIQKQYIKTSGELFNSGVNLLAGQEDGVTSMQSLNQMVALTGIRLENLQKVVEKYSSSVNAAGMTKFTKAVSMSSKQLLEMGYSSEESTELMASMIDSQSMYADIRNKSETHLMQDAVSLGKSLRDLSLTFGISTAKLQENIKALSKNSDSMFISALAGKDAAKNFTTFAGGIEDKSVANMLQKLAASPAAEATETFRQLVQAGEGSMAQEFTRLSKLALSDPAGAGKQLEAYMMSIDETRINALQIQLQSQNQGASVTAEAINGLRQQFQNASKATSGQKTGAIAGGKSVAALATEKERIMSLAQVAFPALEKSIDALTATMRTFNNAATPLAATIGATVGNFLSVGAVVVGFGASLALTILSLKTFSSAVRTIAGMANGTAAPGGAGTGRPGAKGGSRVGSAAKGLVGLAGGYALDKAGEYATESGNTKTGAALDIGSSALTGASMGAMIGSVVPVVGTVIGGAIGGALGTALGAYQNKDALFGNTKEPKQSTIDSASDLAAKAKLNEEQIRGETGLSSTPSPATTDKATGTGGINTIMAQQVGILNDILAGTTRLVSINNEILRVSRTHS